LAIAYLSTIGYSQRQEDAMRIAASALVLIVLAGCSSQPRFTSLTGSADSLVMFDNQTAQACYAGSKSELADRRAALNGNADADFSMSTPTTLRESLYPHAGGETLPLTYASEIEKMASEHYRKGVEEDREVHALRELEALPSCRSLAGFKDRE
jgi:hypothetical protein